MKKFRRRSACGGLQVFRRKSSGLQAQDLRFSNVFQTSWLTRMLGLHGPHSVELRSLDPRQEIFLLDTQRLERTWESASTTLRSSRLGLRKMFFFLFSRAFSINFTCFLGVSVPKVFFSFGLRVFFGLGALLN